MKIKDITEGLYDTLTKARAAGKAGAKPSDVPFPEVTPAYKKAQAQAASQFKTNPARATPSQPAAPGQRVLDPDVEVLSAVNPIILKFNGKRYTRQPNGQWTKLGQTKALDMPMQQFLSKELAKL